MRRPASLVVAPLLVSLGLGLFAACGTATAPPSDAKPVLRDVTNNVVLPTYRELDAKAALLSQACGELAAAPSEATLDRAQAAWRAARRPWRQSDAFRFGPVESKQLTQTLDYFPANVASIEALVGGSAPIDAALLEDAGANVKGFMALEYLLFDSAAGNARVVASLTGEGPAPRRRMYLTATAEHVKRKTALLLASWEPSGEDFAGELINAGESGVFPSAKSAVDQLVNQSAFAGDNLANTMIGKPFGKKTGGQPVPELEHTSRSDNSLAEMQDTLEGVRSVYLGAYGGVDALGIGDLVRPKNPSLDGRVVDGLDAATAKVRAIPPPFRAAITAQREPVEQAYQAVKGAKTLFSVEVAGVLGTTLKFNDNDGD